MTHPSPPMRTSTPRLSLCLIVKNEADQLPAFLEVMAGVFDELCITDTGSTDGTLEIASQAGAVLSHFAWCDDFSAARNHNIATATGDWILFMDPDERPTAGFARAVRDTISQSDVGAATLIMENRFPHGHVRRSALLRLFRRDPSIRFRFPIHEDVTESVQAFLARTGLRLAASKAQVVHFGYERSFAASRDKKNRDITLLTRCVQADPTDLYSHHKLLEQARFWGDVALLSTHAPAARAALQAGDASSIAHVHGEFVVLIAQGLSPTPGAEQLKLLEELAPPFQDAAFLMARGTCRAEVGDQAGARADFETCLSLLEQTRNEQLATTRPRVALARLALHDNDLALAQSHLDAALAHTPRDPEALLASLLCEELRAGAGALPTKANALTRRAQAQVGETDSVPHEVEVALGELHLLRGRAAAAAEALRRAYKLSGDAVVGLKWAQACLAQGDLSQASQLCLELASEDARASVGLLLCQMGAGAALDVHIDLDEDTLRRTLEEWLRTVFACRTYEVLEGIAGALPLVADALPFLGAFFEAELEKMKRTPSHIV